MKKETAINTSFTSIDISPNPIVNALNVDLSETKKGKNPSALIQILNQAGEIIHQQVADNIYAIVNLKHIPNGVYQIKVAME